MSFTGKTVIVTGAGRGIGLTVARAYALQGAGVVIAERNREHGSAAEQLLRASGSRVSFIQVDTGEPEQVVELMGRTAGMYGSINILINNAGVWLQKSLYELTTDEWDNVLDTNLRGAFLCSREAARFMRGSGGGSIVNIASTRAVMSEADTEAYSASKGGILALTHALAVSLAPDHIRVNSVSPGWIETGDYDALRGADHRQHPAGRVGRPEDVAEACLFLTGPGSGFITGTNLVVDGGMTRKMIYEV